MFRVGGKSLYKGCNPGIWGVVLRGHSVSFKYTTLMGILSPKKNEMYIKPLRMLTHTNTLKKYNYLKILSICDKERFPRKTNHIKLVTLISVF